MKKKQKNILKNVLVFTIIIIGYLAIFSLTSWMFRKGIEDNNVALLVISGISLLVHSFFIIWLNYEFSFRKLKKKKIVNKNAKSNAEDKSI